MPVAFFDDFVGSSLVLESAAQQGAVWDLTANSGTINFVSQANGILELDGGTVAAQSPIVALPVQSFPWAAGQKIKYRSRVSLETIVQGEIWGMSNVDASGDLYNNVATSIVMGFSHQGDGNLRYHVNDDGSSHLTGLLGVTLVAGTWYEMAFEWTGTKVQFFVNGVLYKTITPTNTPATVLGLTMQAESLTTASSDFDIDFVGAWAERSL